jgi:hypothetical protein
MFVKLIFERPLDVSQGLLPDTIHVRMLNPLLMAPDNSNENYTHCNN